MFVLAYALDRPTEDLRPDRRDRVRPGDVRHRHRQQLQRLPRRHGHSAASASACTWPSTSRLLPTCCPTKTTMPRISACSTSPALFPLPSRRRSRPSSWRSLAAVTAVTTVTAVTAVTAVLYAVAGICSIIGGAAILPVSASDERLLHRRCASHQHRTHLRGQACGSPGHRKQQLIRPLAEKVAASASGLLVLVQWHPCLAVREHGVPETATKVVGPTLQRPP